MSHCPNYGVDDDSNSDSEFDKFGLEFDKKQVNSVVESRMSENIKIIPQLGHQAGLNKQDFDTTLDKNAENWFVNQ